MSCDQEEQPARCLAQVPCRATHTWGHLPLLLANSSKCCLLMFAELAC